MSPALHRLARWSAHLLLVAPILVGAGFLLGALLSPPIPRGEGRPTPELELLPPLAAGDRFAVVLPTEEEPIAALVATLATRGTSPEVEFEVCAEGRCSVFKKWIRKGDTSLSLPLPSGIHGGDVTLTLRSLQGGELAFWGREEAPLLRPAPGGWLPVLARAEAQFTALAGGGFRVLVALNVLALIGVLAFAIRRLRPAPRELSRRPD